MYVSLEPFYYGKNEGGVRGKFQQESLELASARE